MKKPKVNSIWRFGVIVVLSFLCLGAFWNRSQDKLKEDSAQKTTHKAQIIAIPAEALPPEPAQASKEPVAVVGGTPEQQKDVEDVKAELEDIITRTQELQNQVKDNRSEIQQIMERAQIHERILRDISAPKIPNTRQQLNADVLLRQEKIRLISQQARQTQEQLKVIQQTRALRALQTIPSDGKPSKTT